MEPLKEVHTNDLAKLVNASGEELVGELARRKEALETVRGVYRFDGCLYKAGLFSGIGMLAWAAVEVLGYVFTKDPSYVENTGQKISWGIGLTGGLLGGHYVGKNRSKAELQEQILTDQCQRLEKTIAKVYDANTGGKK